MGFVSRIVENNPFPVVFGLCFEAMVGAIDFFKGMKTGSKGGKEGTSVFPVLKNVMDKTIVDTAFECGWINGSIMKPAFTKTLANMGVNVGIIFAFDGSVGNKKMNIGTVKL